MVSPMDDQDIRLLEGDILIKDGSSGSFDQSYNTLDEPVKVTLLRDLRSIFDKIKCIMYPVSPKDISKSVLRDWDLWGPLILCTFMVLFLHHYNYDDDNTRRSGPQLSQLFGLIWLGSYITSFNFKMLSISPNPGHQLDTISPKKSPCPSLFQLLCVLGYCLSPPCVGLVILTMIEQFTANNHSIIMFIIKLTIGMLVCFSWPTISCYKVLNGFQDPDKMVLAFYPIALFYFVITCIIITSL